MENIEKKPAKQFTGVYEVPNPDWAHLEIMAQTTLFWE